MYITLISLHFNEICINNLSPIKCRVAHAIAADIRLPLYESPRPYII